MRNQTVFLELKYGKKLDEVINSIMPHKYDNLLSNAMKFIENLYPYIKFSPMSMPDLIFSIIGCTVLLAKKSFSEIELNFLTEITFRVDVNSNNITEYRAVFTASILREKMLCNYDTLKKTLFSFAKHLSKEDFVNLIGIISCFFLVDGSIDSKEREIIYKLYDANQKYL